MFLMTSTTPIPFSFPLPTLTYTLAFNQRMETSIAINYTLFQQASVGPSYYIDFGCSVSVSTGTIIHMCKQKKKQKNDKKQRCFKFPCDILCVWNCERVTVCANTVTAMCVCACVCVRARQGKDKTSQVCVLSWCSMDLLSLEHILLAW